MTMIVHRWLGSDYFETIGETLQLEMKQCHAGGRAVVLIIIAEYRDFALLRQQTLFRPSWEYLRKKICLFVLFFASNWLQKCSVSHTFTLRMPTIAAADKSWDQLNFLAATVQSRLPAEGHRRKHSEAHNWASCYVNYATTASHHDVKLMDPVHFLWRAGNPAARFRDGYGRVELTDQLPYANLHNYDQATTLCKASPSSLTRPDHKTQIKLSKSAVHCLFYFFRNVLFVRHFALNEQPPHCKRRHKHDTQDDGGTYFITKYPSNKYQTHPRRWVWLDNKTKKSWKNIL